MAKTYLSAVKYEVIAKYEVQGVVEKPDIVGAIFGQCEGLLGEDMDLKELQQSGKLGRIEITVNKGKGTTSGEVIIPSSLDQIKTSILAATVETVEKVGPFEAKVKVIKIQDTRKEKRDIITDRAKELLKNMQKFEGVESNELENTVKTEIRTEKIINLNGLQAGPEVETSEEIIIVEGRADVLKLLSYGINNAVAMNGGNIDAPLIGLCKEKKVTVLIDGDRGGELNAKKLASMTKVDFIAKAPDGKEVEELTQKEILLALKRKTTLENAFNGKETTYPERTKYEQKPGYYERNYPERNTGRTYGERQGFNPRQRNFGRPRFGEGPSHGRNYGERPERNFGGRNPGRTYGEKPAYGTYNPYKPQYNTFQRNGYNNGYTQMQQETPIPEEIQKLKKDFEKLKGKSKAKLLDEKKKKIKECEVKDLLETLQKTKKKVATILFDGIITNRLVETAQTKEVKTIIGVKKGTTNPTTIKLYTM